MAVAPIRTPLKMFEEYLQKQGLSVRDAEKMGLMLLTTEEVSSLVGFRVSHCGVYLPYPEVAGGYFRVRVLGAPEGSAKYLSKKGSGQAPPYLPSSLRDTDWSDVYADVGRDLIIVEGEIKAWWGCREGAACIGIGGVDMQAGLLAEDIDWSGRRVFVCFDKDSGWESGSFKPTVARALGRLTSALQRRGASVCHMVLPAGSREDKVGLDDYLRAGGSLAELYSSAVEPPEWCEELAELMEDCVLVTGTNHAHVYSLKLGYRKSVDDFHVTHLALRRFVVEGAKTRVEQLSRVWMLSKERQTASGYVMDPTVTEGYLPAVSDGSLPAGKGVINLWKAYPSFPAGSSDVRVGWNKFMQGLFGEWAGWVGAWVGHMLVRPEEKAHQGVLVVTAVRGIGKSLFGEIVGRVVGMDHYLELAADRVFDKFNAVMEGKVWICVNELEAGMDTKEGQFNALITNKHVSIEPKGRDPIVLDDLRRWYMTTNASNPMRLRRGQRRFLVVCPPRIEADMRGPWGEWVRTEVAGWQYDLEALGEIREWFTSAFSAWEAKNGRWQPSAPVPETEESLDVSEASMTVNQILAAHVVEVIRDMGGVGAIGPEGLKLMPKVFGDVKSTVRAHGGQILKKALLIDGKTREYTIFDLDCAVPSVPSGNGGRKLACNWSTKEELIGKAMRIWQAVTSLSDMQKGHSPLKGS